MLLVEVNRLHRLLPQRAPSGGAQTMSHPACDIATVFSHFVIFCAVLCWQHRRQALTLTLVLTRGEPSRLELCPVQQRQQSFKLCRLFYENYCIHLKMLPLNLDANSDQNVKSAFNHRTYSLIRHIGFKKQKKKNSLHFQYRNLDRLLRRGKENMQNEKLSTEIISPLQ